MTNETDFDKRHRLIAFKKLLYELSKKITPEELNECFENLEPKRWGYAYRDMTSDYDIRIITEVVFTKVDKDKRRMEIIDAENKGQTNYLRLDDEDNYAELSYNG